ncbi:hypothetical protein Ddye_013625 [Dipteronia dyeriana]|uniref:PGG domain-containing protein n=1 Tax=Dipteronia dyeriana TaxID=168575 RepID=A0AAE0CJU0_9ROSI|nr:hypothetical protein Ddye_013625 [Dipteronia dyeriana]
MSEQPNVNPSLQKNKDSVTKAGSSEERQLPQPQSAVSGGVQPNVNPGGSTHQQEAQIAANHELGSAEHLKYYRPLYLAAHRGDWETAKSFIEHDPNALTATITVITKQTVLHVAAFCWQWEFVLKLLELTSPESIVAPTQYGLTVLHYAVQGGSLKTAKALVEKNPDLLQMVNNYGNPPLFFSIWSGNKELVWYLSLKTRVDSPTFPFFIPSLLRILYNLIKLGYHDIALYFVQRYPNLALATDANRNSLLHWLATNPSYFFSGSNLGFLERWIYKFVQVEIRNPQTHLNMEDTPESILMEGLPTLQPRSFATQVLRWFKISLWKTIAQLAPTVKMVRDAKLKHECAVELVNHVCTQLSSMSFQQIADFLQNPNRIMASAVTGGIEEIVRTLFLHFPDLMMDVQLMPERNILQAAIEYRQVKIVNMLKEIHPSATKNISSHMLKSGNTTLHLAGELAPPIKLLSVSGTALQMQRELQWFKEVEMYTRPADRVYRNSENQTAKDVFRKEHKELAGQGEKWMKDTANSCMLVSTLIATVLFAAAFTVPGGNVDDKGTPIFLQTKAFTVFAISNALGLFSSLTSLLMFLAILTARYAQEDFLKSLPKKLIIGLGSLFFAIAAMIIAFGAALTIILGERWHWVYVPITLVASIPVAIFVMLQLPLFVQMVHAFTIFIISDALGLLSALTSLLMFLSILTARYAMEDFLKSLPKRLIIGLGSLFFAIAAMITAFGAALTIILTERWYWVSLPVTLMASFPVAVFVMLQLPLFVQMVQSTYGSIFRHWPSEKLKPIIGIEFST